MGVCYNTVPYIVPYRNSGAPPSGAAARPEKGAKGIPGRKQGKDGRRRAEKMNRELYKKTEYALGLIAADKSEGVDLLNECAGKGMLFVARGIVKDPAAAEDVVQESFLKIVQHIRKYKKGTNGYAWICRIVRNTALNYIGAARKKAARPLDEFSRVPADPDPEEKATDRLLAEALMNSLSPPVVRQMIYMKYFLDMTVREIAKELGKSKSYVADAIVAAEEKMRKILAGQRTKSK